MTGLASSRSTHNGRPVLSLPGFRRADQSTPTPPSTAGANTLAVVAEKPAKAPVEALPELARLLLLISTLPSWPGSPWLLASQWTTFQ